MFVNGDEICSWKVGELSLKWLGKARFYEDVVPTLRNREQNLFCFRDSQTRWSSGRCSDFVNLDQGKAIVHSHKPLYEKSIYRRAR